MRRMAPSVMHDAAAACIHAFEARVAEGDAPPRVVHLLQLARAGKLSPEAMQAAPWIMRGDDERGRTLAELLEFVDALPVHRSSTRPRFPRFEPVG